MRELRGRLLRDAGRAEARVHVPGVLDHSRHLLRGERAPGDDEVALVLAAFVVHDDEELTASERSNGVLNGVERECGASWWNGHFLGPCGGGRGGDEGPRSQSGTGAETPLALRGERDWRRGLTDNYRYSAAAAT